MTEANGWSNRQKEERWINGNKYPKSVVGCSSLYAVIVAALFINALAKVVEGEWKNGTTNECTCVSATRPQKQRAKAREKEKDENEK